MIFYGYLFSLLYAALCLGLAFVMYKLKAAVWVTRKLVHIFIGFEWVILYHSFGVGSIHFLIICILFLFILTLSHYSKLLPMIESTGDNSPGTVYYAVAMSVMSLITMFVPNMIIPFGIGVFCTSLGDGLAGLAGRWIGYPRNSKIYGNKTFFGSLTNALVCFIVAGVFNGQFDLGFSVWYIMAIGLFATELELFTCKGLDNITVTLGVSFLSYFLLNFDGAEKYIIPILLTPLMIAFVYKKKALTVGGIIAAVVVDVIISVSLGNLGFVILLAFFVGGIITDKIKNKYKNQGRKIKDLYESRNHIQVLSNAMVASICALSYLITAEKAFAIAFTASLAEALADTAASGIGVISGKAYDPFRRKKCAVGISGGMSVLGTLASLVGSLLISLFALAIGLISPVSAVIVGLAGFVGALFDSLLGSLIQVKYICPTCNQITEHRQHCNIEAKHHSGIPFVTNNTVNLFGTIFSATLASLVYLFLR